jgi:hypothetical protein
MFPLPIVILITIAVVLISMFLNALFLWLAGIICKSNIRYKKALLPSVLVGSLTLLYWVSEFFTTNIFLRIFFSIGIQSVNVILYFTLPILMFKIEWKKGLLVGLLWIILVSITEYIVFMIVIMMGLAATLFFALGSAV